MTFSAVMPDDLSTYLGTEVDAERAAMMITHATTLAQSIVTPLPDGAEAVILSAVARAYTNPGGVTSETVGPYSATRPSPGLYLTKGERRTLRSLAGQGGGAFTIDPTASTAMTDFIDPLQGPSDQEVLEYLEETGQEGL